MSDMLTALLIVLLTLGGVGVYLALPSGRMAAGRAGLIVLAGLVGVLTVVFLVQVAEPRGTAWFYVTGLVGLWGAVRVVTHRRPVYSALYFVLVAVAVACMLVLMQAELLAFALLMIYAGAILVTYAFVIMLAQQRTPPAWDLESHEPLLGSIAGFVLLAVVASRLTLGRSALPRVQELDPALRGVAPVGTHLLTGYAVGLEIAGVLLLAAMVGAIAIARRRAVEEPP